MFRELRTEKLEFCTLSIAKDTEMRANLFNATTVILYSNKEMAFEERRM
jgi:hypothetical protein